MPKRGIPAHSIGRIFKRIEDIRVSEGCKDYLKIKLEDWTNQIALRALVYMKHAKRKTVMPEDIDLAIKDVFSQV